jgi:hypothetical protein
MADASQDDPMGHLGQEMILEIRVILVRDTDSGRESADGVETRELWDWDEILEARETAGGQM